MAKQLPLPGARRLWVMDKTDNPDGVGVAPLDAMIHLVDGYEGFFVTFVDADGKFIHMDSPPFDSPEAAVAAALQEFNCVTYSSIDELLDNQIDESLGGGWCWAASPTGRPR